MSDIIETKRLVLKPYSDCDQESMIELLTNEKIKETFMIPDFQRRTEVISMFKKLQQFSHSEDHYERGVYVGQQLIGFLNDVEIVADRIELGYVIHPDYHNRGYATEALKASIEHLFQKGFVEIVSGAFVNNKASICVMKKCGMTRIEREEDICYHNETRHCCYYAIRRKPD
ncbi:GNAT family N-acetyltransferase [Caproicibacter fermentans]|uniref:GNAT family N-acetyltransferase n=1 Tax=Caproicibacter fermentans TaxID=2576756 RepID=UPI001E42C8EB|nr:GNAT family N-acetyltransferase [Caproicibacter fermentans]